MGLINLRPRLTAISARIGVPDSAQNYDRLRGSAHSRGYDRKWEAVRLAHLKAEPLCRFCSDAGRVVAATVVDHIQTIADRPDLRLVDQNLRSLCETCHNGHTARQTAAGHRSLVGRGETPIGV